MDEYRYDSPTPRIVSVGVCVSLLMLFFTGACVAEMLDMSNYSMKPAFIGANIIMLFITLCGVYALFVSVRYTYKSWLANADQKK